MKKFTPIRIALALLVVANSIALAGPGKKIVKETEKEFNLEMHAVREGHPLLPVNYVENEGKSYAYYLPRRFLRLAAEGEYFQIDKIHYKKRHVRLELKSSNGAEIGILIYEDQDLSQVFLDEVCPKVLQDLFDFREPLPESRYVGHEKSGKLHLRGCNHLPPEPFRVEIHTLEEAYEKGFEKCPVCFSQREVVPIEGYGPLRNSMIEEARTFEIIFPLVEDSTLQAEIRAIGDSIVENFPVPIDFFKYDFRVVHSEIANARAFYTGFVYVTDKLLEFIEDPLELRFMLAHEITHAALHKPPTLFIPPMDPLLYVLYINRYYAAFRMREIEADIMALMYTADLYGIREARSRCRSALAKLQFIQEAIPVLEVGAYSTHPSYSTRLALFDEELSSFCLDEERIFRALDKQGEEVAQARVLGMSKGVDCTDIYILFQTTDRLNEPVDLSHGERCAKGKDGAGKKITFYEDRVGYVIPPSSVGVLRLKVVKNASSEGWSGMTGYRSSEELFDKIEIKGFRELEFHDVKDVDCWVSPD